MFEVAGWARVHPKTVYRSIREGRLEAIQFGPCTFRVSEDAIAQFLRQTGYEKPLSVITETGMNIQPTRPQMVIGQLQLGMSRASFDNWVKVRPDYELLYTILDGLHKDGDLRCWIHLLEAQENIIDTQAWIGHEGTGVKMSCFKDRVLPHIS